ncbi:MAG: beta strand repeat-containing protein, partial [Paracoccaceae bacterium]
MGFSSAHFQVDFHCLASPKRTSPEGSHFSGDNRRTIVLQRIPDCAATILGKSNSRQICVYIQCVAIWRGNRTVLFKRGVTMTSEDMKQANLSNGISALVSTMPEDSVIVDSQIVDPREKTSVNTTIAGIATVGPTLQNNMNIVNKAEPPVSTDRAMLESNSALANGLPVSNLDLAPSTDLAETPNRAVGLLNDEVLTTGSANDRLVATEPPRGDNVIGIENRASISTGAGQDLLGGPGNAIGVETAVAYGILNEGTIDLGPGDDRANGTASATGPDGGAVSGSATAFGYSEIDTLGNGASRLITGTGADSVTGTATALGIKDVGAFGLIFENANTGGGNDSISGRATAEGEGSTEARSISIGVSDVDDDALEPPQSGAALGTLLTGGDNDRISAETLLTVNAGPDDQVFFAGANGITVDGGLEAQWREIVAANASALAQAAAAQAAGDRFAVTRAVQPLLAQLQTSTLDMGSGNDTLTSTTVLRVNGLGFEVDPEDDLEVIADAIENGGTMRFGDGNDRLEITTDSRSTIDGAKTFADAHDNASIGLLSGYSAIATQVLRDLGLIGAGSANPEVNNVEVEVTNSALFDLGSGNDRIITNTFASAVDDIPSADGLSNRGLWVGGNGSENLNLKNVTVFVLGEVLNGGDDGEQREGISDGWESRNLIFMDDIVVRADGTIVEGATTDDGADLVKTDATAFGNGVLTISDGFEGREFTNTGGGNDTFDVTGRAFTTARGDTDTVGILAQNVTAATGLQTEQVDEGDFLMRDGDDRVIGRALAAPALGLDPFAFDAAAFAPETFDPASDLFANRTTIAQGISQVTADTLATNNGAVDLGILDTSGAVGSDADLLDGTATAFGVADVQSYGILLTNAVTGRGNDTLDGEADATGRNAAFANGIAVGMSANNDNDGRVLRPDQIGTLSTGGGGDVLIASATATTFTDGTDRIAAGLGDGTVVVSEANADSNGVLIDLGSTIDLGTGNNRVTATADAIDSGIGGANNAVTADGIESRGNLLAGMGTDVISGVARAESQGGVLLTIAGGIDNGFGSTRNNIPAAPTISTGDGADNVKGVGTVVAIGGIGLASGIETSGLIDTGTGNDRVSGTSTVTVTDGINAVADGSENSDIGSLGGGLITTGNGNDTLFARATATGVNTN